MIRPATIDDAPALAEIHVQAWLETYTGLIPHEVMAGITVDARERQWRFTFEHDNAVLIAELEGKAVGFSSIGLPRETGADIELFTLYLLKAFQGRGIGRSLWDAALEAAKARGAKTLRLWVLETNPTRGFYERVGGMLEGRKTDVVRGVELIEVSYLFELTRLEGNT
jgi:ribosomal protein S18 acetylase RimI-like enzyme